MFKKRFFSIGALLLSLMILLGACATWPQKPLNSVDSGQTKQAADLSIYPKGDLFITPQELKKRLGDQTAILVDTSKPDVYEKGHIPGAIGIGWHGLSQIVGKPGDPLWGTTLDKEALTKKLESYGVTNSTLVVFTSNVLPGPGSDGRNVWQLRMAGLDNVKLLYGGNPYWKELGYEMTKEASPKPALVTGLILKEFDKSYSADKNYVYTNLGKTVSIDARTEKEYKGSQDAGEARGGHIKGTKNLVWSSVLNENGTPKRPEEIIKRMADLGVTPQDDFVVY
ncbi:sulfurtransferase [Desulfosporosinus metallidurans]|uniref:thiosulfate sulfurtransferase n=1 Tax=Desulfosporosinus metallidurans TaxID=1888891 RepID=A0A1Q8R0S0_9FIRM|nr:rhodanese-like domain-containing protein [Desulfosporosinus metallidurans]OLN33194.1 Thiosulfate sulfurtransferase, rhodanese [Desulfosporosinus metallidurans]